MSILLLSVNEVSILAWNWNTGLFYFEGRNSLTSSFKGTKAPPANQGWAMVMLPICKQAIKNHYDLQLLSYIYVNQDYLQNKIEK